MTKESAAWLAIRLVGLLLLGQSLYFVFSSAVSFLTLDTLKSIAESEIIADTVKLKADRQLRRAQVDVGIMLVKAFVVGGLAYYFLRGGKAVHAMLVRETT